MFIPDDIWNLFPVGGAFELGMLGPFVPALIWAGLVLLLPAFAFAAQLYEEVFG